MTGEKPSELEVSLDKENGKSSIYFGQTDDLVITIKVPHGVTEGIYIEYICFKDRNLFHRVDTIGNIFTSGEATSENITDGVHKSHEWKYYRWCSQDEINFDLSPKKTNIVFITCF